MERDKIKLHLLLNVFLSMKIGNIIKYIVM